MKANQPLRILFVEDLPTDTELAERELRKAGISFTSMRVETKEAFLNALEEFRPDLIISDYAMPEFDGMQALKLSLAHDPDLPFVLLTGSMNEETAVACMKAGAVDYIIKEHIRRLPMAVMSALEQQRTRLAKKGAERALRESEKKYNELAHFLPQIVFETDIKGNITFVNHAAYSLSGYSPEEFEKGLNVLQVLVPEDRDRARSNIQRILQGEEFRGNEYTFLRKDGCTFPVITETTPIVRDNQTVGLRGLVIDISERKRAEEALRVSEERYRTILNEMEEGYQEVDLSGHFTFFNEAFLKIFGYSRDEMMGTNFSLFAAEEAIAKKVYRAYNEMYETGLPIKSFEWDIIRKDGARRTLEFYASVLRDSGDRPNGFRGIVRDITDRRLAEEALQESEEKYRNLFENANESIFVAQDGKLVFVNPMTTMIIGYSGEELTARSFIELIHPDDRGMVIDRHLRRMKGEEFPHSYPFRIIHRDGNIRWVELNTVLINWTGKPATLNFLSDITERRQAEEELQRTLDSLRKAFGTTIQVMVSAIEVRDPYTAGHQLRSTGLARAIATEMGLSLDTIEAIRMAGPIHDIGKLSVPAEILSKPTKLTNIEFSLIKEHANKGYEMLKDVESPWPLAEIVYQHHERMDGSGYPRNLKGDEILLEARILAVSDVVESMASHRPYRPALGLDAALEEIENNKGKLYDADVVDACLRLFREKGFQL